MKLKIKEKSIENEILSFLKRNGIFAWKNESVGIYDAKKGVFRRKNSIHRIVGTSDILGIFYQRFLAIEVKSKTGKLSDAQCAFLEAVKNNGGIAFVARSVDDVIDAFEFHCPFITLKYK